MVWPNKEETASWAGMLRAQWRASQRTQRSRLRLPPESYEELCRFSGTAGILGESGRYYPSIFGPNAFFNSQFHSLYAWRSVGNSNYHAMQVNVRKRMAHGIQFDFNYTYSKWLDLSSDAERVDGWSDLGGQLIISWSPNQLRGVYYF